MNFFTTLFILISLIYVASCCNRSPTNLPHGRRTRGDNGYKLIIADIANGYVPKKTYNVLLLGSRNHEKIQFFKHFKITAEGSGRNRYRAQSSSPKRVGRFQLFDDALTKFNEQCVNTVSEADDLPKSEVQLLWVAPESGSGCIKITAMVYESPTAWYSDDGELSKIICEKKTDTAPEGIEKRCCACDEAQYKFTFEGIWSNETHPKDYPFAIWLTHFSDVIGASHDANFSFWGENHIATDGFRSLAEWGSISALETELRAKGPRLRTLIKATGLWYPHVNDKTSSRFRVDRKHPQVSMVSMFGPSPDWIVGINGVDLCTQHCSWKESMDFDLYPWDAGTDSGISYMSPNIETQPRERMYRITTMFPEDPRAPFYNPNGGEMIPLAKLHLQREKIISRNCDEDFLQALQLEVENDNESQDVRAECRVGDYSEWGPCSVTCGKGIRMRTRQYHNPNAAEIAGCDRQLVLKEMCLADITECGSETDDDETENLAHSQLLVNEDGEGSGVCKTSPWSAWSECSVPCGIGITMRTRTFLNHLGRKRCPHITVVEKQKCMRPECSITQFDMPDPECPTTQWSDWSPCTATCGRGVTIRERLLLVEDEEIKQKCKKRMELHQQKECQITSECSINSEDICSHQPDIGPCRGSYLRYAFNKASGLCESFTYGGCRGNSNNFLTENDCLLTCRSTSSSDSIVTSRPDREVAINHKNDSEPKPCIMSEWSPWSKCSVPCGLGYSESHRYIISEPSNGGQPCPQRTKKRLRCTVKNCEN